MKPNDKAYAAAIKIYNIHSDYDAESVSLRLAVDAAYAAQFPPSEDYAGLVKWLRDKAESLSEIYPPEAEAADALEAVLAERDTYKNWLDNYEKQFAAKVEELVTVRLERDALLARLAPVDDKALVERDDFAEQIALRSENGISKDLQEFLRKFKEDDSAAIRMFAQYRDLEIEMDSWKSLWEKTNAHMRQVEAERDAIAAIRPHIEAAERERCAKAVITVAKKINVAHHERPEWEDGYLQGVHDAAAAIRRGK